jgi:hypothetical protein
MRSVTVHTTLVPALKRFLVKQLLVAYQEDMVLSQAANQGKNLK